MVSRRFAVSPVSKSRPGAPIFMPALAALLLLTGCGAPKRFRAEAARGLGVFRIFPRDPLLP